MVRSLADRTSQPRSEHAVGLQVDRVPDQRVRRGGRLLAVPAAPVLRLVLRDALRRCGQVLHAAP